VLTTHRVADHQRWAKICPLRTLAKSWPKLLPMTALARASARRVPAGTQGVLRCGGVIRVRGRLVAQLQGGDQSREHRARPS